jgi:hypothetical protein
LTEEEKEQMNQQYDLYDEAMAAVPESPVAEGAH